MLLKITESCSMGCTHCMNDAKPCGDDMSYGVLEDVLNFVKLTETYHNLIVTGGEPTEHSDFVGMVGRIIDFLNEIPEKKVLTIATNGFWVVENPVKAKEIVARGNEWTDIVFQISTDSRYYPRKLDTTKRVLREKGFILCKDCVEWVYPQGRAKLNGFPTKYTASSCFNIRAISKQISVRKFSVVVDMLERAGKFCTPAIDVYGSIKLGESDLCPVCSNIYRGPGKIVEDIIAFRCNGCYPLNEGLSPEYKRFVE